MITLADPHLRSHIPRFGFVYMSLAFPFNHRHNIKFARAGNLFQQAIPNKVGLISQYAMRRRDSRNELVPCGLRNHEFVYPEYVVAI